MPDLGGGGAERVLVNLVNNLNREKFDVAVARAVAKLNTLLEDLLPLVKVGGIVIAYKGSNLAEEFMDAEKALDILGGKILKSIRFDLPNS